MHHAFAALAILACAATVARAQVLPPLYNPLADPARAAAQARSDSLHAAAATVDERASTLRESAALLRSSRADTTAIARRLSRSARVIDSLRANLAIIQERDRLMNEEIDRLQASRGQYELRAREGERTLQALRNSDIEPDQRHRVAIQVFSDSSVAAALAESERELVNTWAAVKARRDAVAAALAGAESERDLLARTSADAEADRADRLQVADRLVTLASTLEAQRDSLIRDADRALGEVATYNAIAGREWAPIRTATDGERFFGMRSGVSTLRNVVLSYAPNTRSGAVFTEVAADFVGPVRLGLGVALAQAAAESEDSASRTDPDVSAAAATRFLTGGGNLSLNAMWIGLYTSGDAVSVLGHVLGRLSVDIPSLGSPLSITTLPVSSDVGIEVFATVSTLRQVFKLTLAARAAMAYGTTAFYDQLGAAPVADGLTFYQQFTAGLRVANLFSVVVSGAVLPGGATRPVLLGVQVGG